VRLPITRHNLSIDVDCDCNDDGVVDWQAIASGVSQDCNHNKKPDDCDIAVASQRTLTATAFRTNATARLYGPAQSNDNTTAATDKAI